MQAFAMSFMATIVLAIPAGNKAGVISEPVPMEPPAQPLATECPVPDPAGPVVIQPEAPGADCQDLVNVSTWGSEIPLGEPQKICDPYAATEEACSTIAR
jgi:hypothetical protein